MDPRVKPAGDACGHLALESKQPENTLTTNHCPTNPALAAAAFQMRASCAIIAAKSEDELAMVSRPLSARICCTSGKCRMRTISWCRRAVIAAGRSRGASRPIQARPGAKAGTTSVIAGTSGSLA